MSFDWAELQTLAVELTANQPISVSDEARWRCAISRSYYAAYHTALALAEAEGYKLPANMGSHEGLIRYYQTHPNSHYTEIGIALDDLKAMRVKADYQRFPRFPTITRNSTLLHLIQVRDVLENLRNLPHPRH